MNSLEVEPSFVSEAWTFKNIALGVMFGLPIFFELSAGGISFPDSHYKMSGFAFHMSMLCLVVMLFSIKLTKEFLILAVSFAGYCSLSLLQDTTRFLLAFQSAYFIVVYYLLNHFNNKDIIQIALTSAISLLLFSALHIVSIVVESSGNVLGLFSNATKFWGFTIYQSHLTYPLTMIMALLIFEHSPHKHTLKTKIGFLSVTILEVLLMRRISLAIYLSYLLLYRRKMLLYVLPVLVILVFLNYDWLAQGFVSVVDRVFNAGLSRSNTWNQSLSIMSEPLTLFVGNGKNNYSHNYFMHTITTHGLLYSLTLFFIVGKIMWNFFAGVRFAARPCLLMILLVALDWNLNANLYQPYYASLLAITLIYLERSFETNTDSDRDWASLPVSKDGG